MFTVIFYFFLLLTVASAGVVLWSRNVMYSAFALMLTFLGIAALYVTAGADFIAVTQLMVYIGGILVLLIFGVMLTRKPADNQTHKPSAVLTEHGNRFWGIVLAGGFFTLLLIVLLRADFATIEQQNFESQPVTSKLSGIGISLMTDYVLPLEVIGVLLMIALMGAAYLAKKV